MKRRMQTPSDIDATSCEGLTRLFRFAVRIRVDDTDRAALRRLEKRFGLLAYEPQFRGGLEDLAKHLDGLERDQRFAAVYGLISGALSVDEKLDAATLEELLHVSKAKRIVRFSFAPFFLLCLRHAYETQPADQAGPYGYVVRYAGIGPDKELMAFACLFLKLAVYTEPNPPWDPDAVFENGEPNSEPPDLEISYPPANFHLQDATQLEESVRKSRLPRAVDRGKYDLESVVLEYLCDAKSSALVFTSELFLASTKQSRLLTRQHLLDLLRIRQVSELTLSQPHQFAIELGDAGREHEVVRMAKTSNFAHLSRASSIDSPVHSKSALIPVEDIRSAGDCLRPGRYLGTGPAGGQDLAARMKNTLSPTKYRLADFFEIIRPKTTKSDPVGTLSIQEARAGNISANGEISGDLRRITVRSTLSAGLEEQIIKPGDILFAHRGPVGHVAYVSDAEVQGGDVWAGQTLLIFRARRRSASDRSGQYCAPRALFMYMLMPDVKSSWRRLAIGDRSPAIPIGQIESFRLPENLLLPNKPRQTALSIGSTPPRNYTEILLAEFQLRQNKLKELSLIQSNMNEGLDRVWKASWSKPISDENR